MDYAQASLTAENRATTRFLAAACEEKAGLWIEAFSDYQNVGDTANKSGLFDVANNAKQRAQTLQDKIPKIILRKPANVEGLVVKMNDVEVSPEKLNGEVWINPGQRAVKATGKLNGVELEFEQTVDATEFETTTVDIKLGPKGVKDQAMVRCMLAAKDRDDFAKCLNKSSGPSLSVRASTEVSGYHDTDHVDVISPAWLVGVDNPTGGWGVTGTFLVDVVTRRLHRHRRHRLAALARGALRADAQRPQEVRQRRPEPPRRPLHEPDYLATGAGAGFSIDLLNKRLTPSIGYDFGYNLSGRSGTPFSVYGHKIIDHGIDVAASIVLDKATVVSGTVTMVFENGDSSKPYRYIPMFPEDQVKNDTIPAGLSIKGVNTYRLPLRILEQLPTNRQRYAVAGFLAHRFSSSTLRAEERLYNDSWGQKASTTELLFFADVSERVRLWPQLRFNIQTGTSFWHRAYPARPVSGDTTNTLYEVPTLRTGDRELGPLYGVTLGGGARFALGEKKNWALSFTGDAVYTRFLDHLFILDRLGFFGATTLEVDFE